MDKERICIMGASYGGYSALAGGAFTPDLYKCVIAINGLSDLERFIRQEESDHGDFSSNVDYWKDQFFGLNRENEGKIDLRDLSPRNFAEDFKASVMLVHAKDDQVVDIEQSNLMRRALEQADKNVEFISLKGETHYLINEESRSELLENSIRFINENIGGDN